jgi:hypothetical protein
MSDSANKRNTSGLSKPGMTNNPNGRPKTPESVKLAFAGMMPLALEAMRAILDGSDTEARASDRIKAADIVFDRNLGKAVETVNMESQVNYVDTSKLTQEQKEAIARLGHDD